MTARLYLNHLGLIGPLGQEPGEVLARLGRGEAGLRPGDQLPERGLVPVGAVDAPLPQLPPGCSPFASRNNRLLYAAFLAQETALRARIEALGPQRVGLVVGTSTSGVAETEQALAHLSTLGSLPENFDYFRQEVGNPAAFLQQITGIQGPAYGLSTACSSSAKAFGAAAGLIRAGIIDGALVAGVDSLCALTLNGFASLEALSPERCAPFDQARRGLNIGEGAALFWLGKEPGPVEFLACGESSDAHHMSAPHPEGRGAAQAMQDALTQAGLAPEKIGYLNLHGTATPLNDQMEAKAVAQVFGLPGPPASSTKAYTGHLLGAAGAMEAAFCYLLLNRPGAALPPQTFPTRPDPELPQLNWAQPGQVVHGLDFTLSNSFAFGGSNCSLILGRAS